MTACGMNHHGRSGLDHTTLSCAAILSVIFGQFLAVTRGRTRRATHTAKKHCASDTCIIGVDTCADDRHAVCRKERAIIGTCGHRHRCPVSIMLSTKLTPPLPPLSHTRFSLNCYSVLLVKRSLFRLYGMVDARLVSRCTCKV